MMKIGGAIEDAKHVTGVPLQQANSEVACFEQDGARSNEQVSRMPKACTKKPHDRPFIIELGRMVRRAVIGL